MSESDDELFERLAGLGRAAFAPPRVGDIEMSAHVFEMTSAVQRRRRVRFILLRVACTAAAAMVLFVAGRWSAPYPLPVNGMGHPDEVPSVIAAEPNAADVEERDPVRLEIRAATAPLAERIRLLSRAGDLWLTEHDSLEDAARCYGEVVRMIPEGPSAQEATSGTWLYAAMNLIARSD